MEMTINGCMGSHECNGSSVRAAINGMREHHDLLIRADRDPAQADRQVLSSMRPFIASVPIVSTPKSPSTARGGI
jgi:hypothetical protein